MTANVERSSVLALLRDAIGALTAADAAALESLEGQARQAAPAPPDRKAALEQYRALGFLLGMTRRNLRLLRGEAAGTYGNPGGPG